jgi:hypothetical protein
VRTTHPHVAVTLQQLERDPTREARVPLKFAVALPIVTSPKEDLFEIAAISDLHTLGAHGH